MHLGFLPRELSNIEARPNLFQGAPVSYLGALLKERCMLFHGSSNILNKIQTGVSLVENTSLECTCALRTLI